MKPLLRIGTWTVACFIFASMGVAHADYRVDVGYADNLRPSPFFPTPWDGDAGVTFLGGGGSYDSGAFRIVNTGLIPIVVTAGKADSFGDGTPYDIWTGFFAPSITISPGNSLVFTQTGAYNFDSSDNEGVNPAAIPRVTVTVDGITKSFLDTAQVLNTEGTDALAQAGLNESHQWREIGTFGGQGGNPTPEPASLTLLGIAGVCFGGYAWRRRKLQVA